MLRPWLDMALSSLLWLCLPHQGFGPGGVQGCLPSWESVTPAAETAGRGGRFNTSHPNQGLPLSAWKALHLTLCSVNRESSPGYKKLHVLMELKWLE